MGEWDFPAGPEREESSDREEGPSTGPGRTEAGSPPADRIRLPGDDSVEAGRIQPNKHRSLQVARTGERKLFDKKARKAFLEWFAATGNVLWSAQKVGFSDKTVWKHRMNDPRFAEAFDRAFEQSVARNKARMLERKAGPIGIDGGVGESELGECDLERAWPLIVEIERAKGRRGSGGGAPVGRPPDRGRMPRAASNAQVRRELTKRLEAFGRRLRAEGKAPPAWLPPVEPRKSAKKKSDRHGDSHSGKVTATATVASDRADFGDLLERAAWAFSDSDWEWLAKGLSAPVRRRMFEEFFHWQTHGGQAEPPGGWRVWFLRAGRGFGKTMTGAQWVLERARETPGARIALVGGSLDEVRKVMIEGPGGLIAQARCEEPVEWNRTQGIVLFHSGAKGFVYSARAAETLRGPEHHFAWCDELAKWKHQGDPAWDNLQMGMRLGERPRLIVTTTPRPTALVRRVRALEGTAETLGRTSDNVHSAQAFRSWAQETYGGTRLGRQELDGVLFEEVDCALWTREILEKARAEGALPRWRRVVVGVDPPVSADGDSCGIVACALGADGIAYVLADCTVHGERPEGWARAVVRTAEAWGADRVVAEKNQGGDMVESVLRNVEAGLPVKLVHAHGSKSARAEPVAALFETGRAKLAGRFAELEDQLAGMTHGGGYEGPGNSPDRADAMVWAMSILAGPRPEPRVRRL